MSARTSALGRSGRTENTRNLSDEFSLPELEVLAVSRVHEARALYKPVYVAGALSGGHDSMTACGIAARSGAASMAHFDTGVGLKATEAWVAQLCRAQGWKLEVYKALECRRANGKLDPQDYFAIIEEHGFPGPGMHYKMYQRLKQRAMIQWAREHKKWRSREVVILVGGSRIQESDRRGRNVVGPHNRDERVVWCNPLYDFSKFDCLRLMVHMGIPRSPVVDLIHKSGECLCGSFGKPGELEETTLWFPTDETVVRLNEAHNRLKANKGWGWGGRPPGTGCKRKMGKLGPMCSSCELNFGEIQKGEYPLTTRNIV